MSRLKDKVALVTGASSGIGLAVARRFAAEGAQVIAVARREQIVRIGADIPGRIVGLQADVSKPGDVDALIAACSDRFGRLDVLCNNAGTRSKAGMRIHETTLDDWDMVMATNLRGVFLTLRGAIPLMLEGVAARSSTWPRSAAFAPRRARRRSEGALLKHYLQALRDRGVAAPDFAAAWEAHRREIAYGLFIFLINETRFQTEAVNSAYTARFGAAALDHGTAALLAP